MKQRILTTAIGLVLLVAVLFGYDSPAFPTTLAILSGLAVYEVLVPTRLLCPKSLGILHAVVACLSFFLLVYFENLYLPVALGFAAILILYTIRYHQRLSYQKFCTCIFTVIAIPYSFYALVQMDGVIYAILAAIAAWITDMSAFFVGKTLGKKKLAPRISPNKTVEGAIGGLIAAGIVFPATCYGYWLSFLPNAEFSLLRAFFIGCICSVAAMIGDLFASMIKRQAGIKDFGNIMPGHGGIMDRFDSLLFVAPVLYFLNRFFPIFAI